jgi:hypothetical protein
VGFDLCDAPIGDESLGQGMHQTLRCGGLVHEDAQKIIRPAPNPVWCYKTPKIRQASPGRQQDMEALQYLFSSAETPREGQERGSD